MRRSTGSCNRRNSMVAIAIPRSVRRSHRKWRRSSKRDGANMDSKVVKIGAARPRSKTYYERWMEKEGIPIIEGFGVTDVGNLTLKPWTRVGGEGAYLQLRGL